MPNDLLMSPNSSTVYEVWVGFDQDDLELFRTFDDKEEAFLCAENCHDFNDLVEVIEDSEVDS